ncbi:Polynucleotide 5'-hydroxyl-kinase grc3, partial [Coemansia furcata]
TAEGNGGEAQPPMTDGAVRKGSKLAAHDMRALSLISQLYLAGGAVQAQAWNHGLQAVANPQWRLQMPLAAQRPLAVPWGDLVVWVGEEDVPASQLLRALNGAVVGVVAISTAPSPDAHTWTEAEIRGLYSGSGSRSGISDQAAVELSEPGSRALLHSALDEHRPAQPAQLASERPLPHIVYGQPSASTTTFLTHAVVRSVDPAEGLVHLLLPPHVACQARGAVARLSALHRVVGFVKGPGPGSSGVDLPVWPLVDGGYAERSMGSSSVRLQQGRFNRRRTGARDSVDAAPTADAGAAPLGIQEAPYLSVEVDEGIGATSTRSKGGMQRRALQ